MNSNDEPAHQLVSALRNREISPVELAELYLARIELLNPRLNAFLTPAPEQALAQAREAEKVLMNNPKPPPLTGLPVAVKDTELTKDLRTTLGSLVYQGFVPDEDSTLVERLRAAGAVIIGKTNTPEFAMLGETRNLLGAHCSNPWDLTRTTGGSSGGAACAIAAGLAPLASGSDSGGSITIPAAFCGTFGFKPTSGFIPHYPSLMDWPLFLSSGPLTRTVEDAAWFLSVACGHDARDPLSYRGELPDFLSALEGELPDFKIGFATTVWERPVDEEIQNAVRHAASVFESLGCQVSEIRPEVPPPYESWHTIDMVDQWLARGYLLENHANELFEGNAARLEQGRLVTSEALAKAHVDRYRFCAATAELFSNYDLLMLPATACTAFPHAEPPSHIGGQASPGKWDDFAPFNLWANLSGEPSACLPIGFSDGGLPIGALLIAPRYEDGRLLRLAAAFEVAEPWVQRLPSL